MRANPYCYRYPKSKSHKVQIKVGKHWLILVFLKNVLCLLIVKEASAPAAVVNNPVTEKIVSLSQSRSVLNLIVSPADHGAIIGLHLSRVVFATTYQQPQPIHAAPVAPAITFAFSIEALDEDEFREGTCGMSSTSLTIVFQCRPLFKPAQAFPTANWHQKGSTQWQARPSS